MYDQSLFLQTLSRFARVLPAQYDLELALVELTESVAAVLGLVGSGVTMAEDGRLRFVTAVSQASGELERIQEEQQAGPCQDAYDTGEVVLGARRARGNHPVARVRGHGHPAGRSGRRRDPDATQQPDHRRAQPVLVHAA